MADNAEDAPRASRKLSRRDWLVAGGGGLAAAAVGKTFLDPAGAAGDVVATKHVGDPLGPSICGTLKNVRDGAVLLLENCHPGDAPLPGAAQVSSGSDQELPVAADAKFWRNGPVDLDGFKAGDKLVVYVRSSGSSMEAWAIEPLLESITAVVTARDGDVLKTAEGAIVLNSYTSVKSVVGALAEGRLGDIRVGHRVGAMCLRDPDTGDLIAQNVSVVA
jgi:hypothetical protein